MRHLQYARRMILLTLVFASAAGASQSLVLCLGHDGHVAIEPAGHHHCGAEHARAPDPADPHSHIADDHCRPCTDIPITLWTDECPEGSRNPRAAAVMPAVLLALPYPTDASRILPGLSGSPPPTSYHTPLYSIILQV